MFTVSVARFGHATKLVRFRHTGLRHAEISRLDLEGSSARLQLHRSRGLEIKDRQPPPCYNSTEPQDLPHAASADAPALALQMGHTTTAMLFAHYKEVVTPEAAEAYWQIVPIS